MPLDMQIIRAREFIRMDGHGHIQFEQSREALKALGEACRSRGIDRAMLDVRDVRSDLTSANLLALAQMFREVGFSHGQRLALLYSTDPFRRVRRFAFLGTLRGWQVRAFNDFEKAIEWLAMTDSGKPGKALKAEKDELQLPAVIGRAHR
jgi:hypothetical protein